MRVSMQFIEDNDVMGLPSWSIPAGYTASMEDSLVRVMNSTKVNQGASPSKRYRLCLSEYELACDRLDARVYDNGALILPNDGCAMLTLLPMTSADPTNATAYMIQGPRGRAKVVIPTQAEEHRWADDTIVSGISLLSQVTHPGQECTTADNSYHSIKATRMGLVTSPTTVLIRCQLSSGEMASLSLTGIHFTVPNQGEFHSVASSIFKDQDEFVSGMQDSANNGTYPPTGRYSRSNRCYGGRDHRHRGPCLDM